MFEIGWSELLVIGVVALIAIGPKELPGVLRSVGHWMGKIRKMAAEFQGQFQEAMREAEMSDLKKTADDLNAATQSLTNFDPYDILKDTEAKPVTPPATSPAPEQPPVVEPIPAVDAAAAPEAAPVAKG
jgi:sec-independent protein translocase protein TatB